MTGYLTRLAARAANRQTAGVLSGTGLTFPPSLGATAQLDPSPTPNVASPISVESAQRQDPQKALDEHATPDEASPRSPEPTVGLIETVPQPDPATAPADSSLAVNRQLETESSLPDSPAAVAEVATPYRTRVTDGIVVQPAAPLLLTRSRSAVDTTAQPYDMNPRHVETVGKPASPQTAEPVAAASNVATPFDGIPDTGPADERDREQPTQNEMLVHAVPAEPPRSAPLLVATPTPGMTGAATAEPAPVDVHIGTIEIIAEPAPPPVAPRARTKRTGLDTYSDLRSYQWGDLT